MHDKLKNLDEGACPIKDNWTDANGNTVAFWFEFHKSSKNY